MPRRAAPRTALTVLALLFSGLLVITDVLRPLELASIDARFGVRGAEPGRTAGLLIVGIDAASLQTLGRFPIHRRYYAQALDRLRRAGARLVVVDVQFTEPSDPRDDDALIAALRRTRGTILVTTDTTASGANDVLGGPDAQRYARVRVASGALPTDPGRTLRRFDFLERGVRSVPVMAASALAPGFTPARLGSAPVWIDYAGGPGTVGEVSLAALLAGRVPPRLIRGRTVLIGATDPALQDLHNFSLLSSGQMTGVEIEANAVATALDGAPLRDAAGWLAALLTVLVGCAGSLLAFARSQRLRPVALLAVAAAYLIVAQITFDGGAIVPVADPIVSLIVIGAVALATSYLLDLRAQAEQVTAARLRAVQAADEARRRVERDLHDGVQQRLIALAMRLSAAGARPDPELLTGSAQQLRLALEDLRQLARGAYPVVLQEAGLAGALQSLADHAEIPVALNLDGGLDELSEEQQRAAYFVAAEALANTLKHAEATLVKIAARSGRRHFTLTVSDNGQGGADPLGTGLAGLRERAIAVGGTLEIASAMSAGTTLTLVLPLDGPNRDPRASPEVGLRRQA